MRLKETLEKQQNKVNKMNQIATEILRQLGGNKFVVMTGAKNFCYGQENGNTFLAFRLPNRKVNTVKITLTATDDYNMEFTLWRGLNCKVVKEYHGVYCDQLQELFTEATGPYTHL